MTARQQIARLLPLVLLVVLVYAGLRGDVPPPRWNGPFRAYGVAIGIALEVIFGILLIVVRARAATARRAAELRPYTTADRDIEPPEGLRFTLTNVLTLLMIGVGIVLVSNIHLHFFIKPHNLVRKFPTVKGRPKPLPPGAGGPGLHIPVAPILYGLLVAALVAAVVISVWWSSRLRRPAAPLVIEDVTTEELREAVTEGRAALAGIDDARAAIIACYVAMERSLAERGTARTVADTPDELLARAVASGTVRGGAAGRLTVLFYEARFSTHPLSAGKRDAASAALDDLAHELAARPAAETAGTAGTAGTAETAETAEAAADAAQAGQATGHAPRPGGGWV